MVVASTVQVVDSPLARMVGLLGRRRLAPGHGLLIRPCSSVHTFLMLFPIDIVFLHREGRVVKVAERVSPFRAVLSGSGAWQALELPAGTSALSGTRPGDVLVLEGEARGGAGSHR
jgi:uncharacterized membrane protein (UPF0127 family)